MSSDHIKQLCALADRKYKIDQQSGWAEGSSTYLQAISNELDEVFEEIPRGRVCFLEDELGDILWNILNAVTCLHHEQGIDRDRVFERALCKYEERINAIEGGTSWADIKAEQKHRLREEQLALEV